MNFYSIKKYENKIKKLNMEKIITYFAAFSLGIVLPVQFDMLAIAILVLADCITGIIAALKNNETFESKKLKQTVVKIFLYEIVILMASMVQIHIFKSNFPLVNVSMTTICIVEFTSLVENLSKYTGNNVASLIKTKIGGLLNVDMNEKVKNQ